MCKQNEYVVITIVGYCDCGRILWSWGKNIMCVPFDYE